MGTPNPRLASRPKLRDDTKWFWAHYLTLAKTRKPNQAGIEPISTSEVLMHLNLLGYRKGEKTLKFLRVIRAMDDTYRAWWIKKNTPPPTSKGKR